MKELSKTNLTGQSNQFRSRNLKSANPVRGTATRLRHSIQKHVTHIYAVE